VHLASGSTETHVDKFFARKLGDLIRVRTCAGPAREGTSLTPSMNADEKSDEVVVPRKRSNKGGQLPAEVAEGRASPEGNSRHAAVVRALSRDGCDWWLCAGGDAVSNRVPADVRPKGGARCVSSARRDLRGGRSVMSVPTATLDRRDWSKPLNRPFGNVTQNELNSCEDFLHISYYANIKRYPRARD
jgi:hypothetical protein